MGESEWLRAAVASLVMLLRETAAACLVVLLRDSAVPAFLLVLRAAVAACLVVMPQSSGGLFGGAAQRSNGHTGDKPDAVPLCPADVAAQAAPEEEAKELEDAPAEEKKGDP